MKNRKIRVTIVYEYEPNLGQYEEDVKTIEDAIVKDKHSIEFYGCDYWEVCGDVVSENWEVV